ncbi:MAG: hypothetical protein OXN27_15630, partial [Candidatus Poribacteria bacterium]|nr:hypothetical protein [Candidatus Poribacteria bacterium]
DIGEGEDTILASGHREDIGEGEDTILASGHREDIVGEDISRNTQAKHPRQRTPGGHWGRRGYNPRQRTPGTGSLRTL